MSKRNQYFVPGDGIEREVISADICKYLDNDATVRPGMYQGREGFVIYAYRNLTSEMISDLQNDSRRWAEEKRRKTRPSGSYLTSQTHNERQSQSTPYPTNTRAPPPQPQTATFAQGIASEYQRPQPSPHNQTPNYGDPTYTFGPPPSNPPFSSATASTNAPVYSPEQFADPNVPRAYGAFTAPTQTYTHPNEPAATAYNPVPRGQSYEPVAQPSPPPAQRQNAPGYPEEMDYEQSHSHNANQMDTRPDNRHNRQWPYQEPPSRHRPQGQRDSRRNLY